jgi:hypothetical protein
MTVYVHINTTLPLVLAQNHNHTIIHFLSLPFSLPKTKPTNKLSRLQYSKFHIQTSFSIKQIISHASDSPTSLISHRSFYLPSHSSKTQHNIIAFSKLSFLINQVFNHQFSNTNTTSTKNP